MYLFFVQFQLSSIFALLSFSFCVLFSIMNKRAFQSTVAIIQLYAIVRNMTANVGPNQSPFILISFLNPKYQAIGIPQIQYPIKFKSNPFPMFKVDLIVAIATVYAVSNSMKTKKTPHADLISFMIGS